MSMIFLSHIHEESELAIILKEAVEEEFSGFVDIFVSSDGLSIPAGSNFLRRIEQGLTSCIAGIYLISPASVNRNWINFELGALWVRNKLQEINGQVEIPTLPVCHSGMTLQGLPQPISNLNSIQGNVASQLEFAFKSLQTAVGGKGRLRTDFSALAEKISSFERKYTVSWNYRRLFQVVSKFGDPHQIFLHIEDNPLMGILSVNLGFVDTDSIQKLQNFEANELRGKIEIITKNPGLSIFQHGAVNGAELELVLKDLNEIRGFKNDILN
ncbi:toll/interleukin-1 receptor domain-containing protein [Paenibacillus polysaccharolyticus]|uniref:toll/interleukin-1 receptor domain-containing protein n=1 Tax=Paenibacillus polysaccharolyticus TaxID=582692 RepID=UPI00280A963C|nr:toll/interleukin-1 receptor domain-containing protein [Paenibacillus polysaccharolyticus]